MVSFADHPDLHDPQALLAPLLAAAQDGGPLQVTNAGQFSSAGCGYEVTQFHFAGPGAGSERLRIGLFAGVHGDEPAGCAALVKFLLALVDEPARGEGYDLFVYPVVNPTGLEDGTRENRAGQDLNREFWRGSAEPEVRIIEEELRARQLHGLITLHADDTCEGHYGYSHGEKLDDLLLRPALLAAERVLPRDRRGTIDGFTAAEGVICDCFQGILAPPPEQAPRPFNIIFETPAQAPMARQIEASVAALDAILATYRGFIAYAQNL